MTEETHNTPPSPEHSDPSTTLMSAADQVMLRLAAVILLRPELSSQRVRNKLSKILERLAASAH